MKSLTVIWLSILLSLIWSPLVQGQTPLIYTVQPGDTLAKISFQYQVSLTDLAAYNQLSNPDLIIVGQQLRIPVVPEDAPVETAEPQIADEAVEAEGSNQPTPLATASLTPTVETALAQVISGRTDEDQADSNPNLPPTYVVKPSDTLFAIALDLGVNMTDLAEANGLDDVNVIDIGQVLLVPQAEPLADILLVLPFQSITFSERHIAQGRTLVISVTLTTSATLSAVFEDRPIGLWGQGRHYWGLVGIHALNEIGVYDLNFRATWSQGRVSTVTQQILVVNGPYHSETIQVIPGRETLLDPEIIQSEFAQLSQLWSEVTTQKYWQGSFSYPVSDTRVTSSFGTRRTYIGGPPASYHSGTDFGGGVGTPVYAPAEGVVVLAEPLQVRGQAILIDHGLGLYSGYWHLNEIFVQPGQTVQRGLPLGHIGNTGLVTGPHLHWEMRLGGIGVEPLQWIEESIP